MTDVLETYTAFIENDLYDIWTLLEQRNFSEAYRRFAPVWEDMLGVYGEAEWLDCLAQQGPELEERPLRLYLAAQADCCLELGGYEGDATEKLLSFLRRDLPEKAFEKLTPTPINLDIDEPDGELEPQLRAWQEQLEPWGCKLRVFFDDTYCGGIYFLFLDAPREW